MPTPSVVIVVTAFSLGDASFLDVRAANVSVGAAELPVSTQLRACGGRLARPGNVREFRRMTR